MRSNDFPRNITLNEFIEELKKFQEQYGHLPVQVSGAYASDGGVLGVEVSSWTGQQCVWIQSDVMSG